MRSRFSDILKSESLDSVDEKELSLKVLVSMNDLITVEKEIGENMVECVTIGVKEEIELASVNLKEEIKSPSVAVDDTCQVRVSVDFSNDLDLDLAKEDCKKETDNGSVAIGENVEGDLVVINVKRGRKRKKMESPECDVDEKVIVKVNSRVLRSRTMTLSGSVKVDESRLNESVIGFKRQMEAECLDQTNLQKEVNKSSQPKGRPQKKQKRCGRPPKITSECLNQTELKNKVKESSQLISGPLKKRKRLGRPPKVHCEEIIFQGIQKRKNKDLKINNLKRPGRPPKVLSGNLSSNAKTPNLLKAKDVKTGFNIQNVQNEDQALEIISEKKQKVNITEESNAQTITEENVKGDDNTKQLKNRIGGLERREERHLVRDKIVSIIMKAGWTIEYRPRQSRQYFDAVYVDEKGKTHWSCTKAYFSLKSKIENKKASSKEVSAFTKIPDEEMSILFRSVSKVRSDKNKKKKKFGKNVRKAEIVFREEAPPKKKPGKKKKRW